MGTHFRPGNLLIALGVLAACKSPEPASGLESLTGPDYKGTKHYFGWAEPLAGWMGNEVRFDVRHTHAVFASEQGGGYRGTVLINGGDVTADGVRTSLSGLAARMGKDDMYVQYSAGHGYDDRLGVGLTYDEIRDLILKLPAREVVVFTMACYSGNLVESFNRRRDAWEDWKAQGRTLFVMSSSGTDEVSATGPGTDPDEPVDARGTAGSRFGFSLWKGLRGAADGANATKARDGKVSLGELAAYVTESVARHEKNQHTPVVTGSWDPELVMAVPAPPSVRDPAWEAQRDRLRPKITELQARLKELTAEARQMPEKLAALSLELHKATPPALKPLLDLLGRVQRELAEMQLRRLEDLAEDAGDYAAAAASHGEALDYAGAAAVDGAGRRAGLDRRITRWLGKLAGLTARLREALTDAGQSAAAPAAAAGRQALLARQQEVTTAIETLQRELLALETEFQAVIDAIIGFKG